MFSWSAPLARNQSKRTESGDSSSVEMRAHQPLRVPSLWGVSSVSPNPSSLQITIQKVWLLSLNEMAYLFSMSVLHQTLIVLPAGTLLNWAQNGGNERQWLWIESDKALQKWKVHARSFFFTFSSKYIWSVFFLERVDTSVVGFFWAHVGVFVCEYVWLTGGTQWGLWLIMVIHTAGSESCQYNLNGKETTGLGCPCFTMLETWHLACVWGPKL